MEWLGQNVYGQCRTLFLQVIKERNYMEYNKIKVNLHSPDKIRLFGQTVRKFLSDVRIESGSRELNAKSILGLFDLNLYGDIFAWIISDNTEENRRFDSAMEEFK